MYFIWFLMWICRVFRHIKSWATIFSVKNHNSNSKIRILNFVFSLSSLRNFCGLMKSRRHFQESLPLMLTCSNSLIQRLRFRNMQNFYKWFSKTFFWRQSFNPQKVLFTHVSKIFCGCRYTVYLFFYSGSCVSYFLQQNCYLAH